MRRVAKNALILAGLVGVAVAVRGYLTRDSATAEGEVQISYDDGSMNSPGPAESEEIAGIARKILEIGV